MFSIRKAIGLITGLLLFLFVFLFTDLDPERPLVSPTLAVALLMASWWITEAIPLAVTALLPLVLFPILGIVPGKEIAPTYMNHIIFVYLGGFMVALAMEKWNLHRRIALEVMIWDLDWDQVESFLASCWRLPSSRCGFLILQQP